MTEINPKYAHVSDTMDMNGTMSSSDDFLDNSHLGKTAILLDRCDDKFIARLGRKTIPMMVSGFSQRAAGAIFVLAYALKDSADGDYVFDMPAEALLLEDILYEELPNKMPATNRAHAPMPKMNNNAEEAQAYSYLAASLLRLFRTNEDNYIGAFNHIVTEYSRFYNKQMPIAPPQPTLEGIRTLSNYFSGDSVFKTTLFRILYCGGGIKKAKRLRSFLYESHLS
ncbi:hypothetical protein PHAVU_002G278800 [Phaseolus vulgaris]|uniref:Uncharacterized protein n=1 Tax=Phaseolus vulgaris TaxID=3885 RepID=V7CP48_PHAVU|nr:hypothetical protein PHAVU_002G278800g [Phaseolus vulgaris]ESW31914.1 hypothetical protein PHAVU_002G278800g [Phaseolus vulgaris]